MVYVSVKVPRHLQRLSYHPCHHWFTFIATGKWRSCRREGKRREVRKGEERRHLGLFSLLWLNQHSPCGTSHLLTVQVTIVEAEVTGVKGERRVNGWCATVAEVCFMLWAWQTHACHSCKSSSSSIRNFLHHYEKLNYSSYDVIESRVLLCQMATIP